MLQLEPRNQIQVQTPTANEKILFLNEDGELVMKNDANEIELIRSSENPNPIVYKGLVTQTGTGAPDIDVIENTIPATITPTYSAVGTFILTASAPTFTEEKTVLTFGSTQLDPTSSEPVDVSFRWISSTVLRITSKSFDPVGPSFDLANSVLTDLPISIEVFE